MLFGSPRTPASQIWHIGAILPEFGRRPPWAFAAQGTVGSQVRGVNRLGTSVQPTGAALLHSRDRRWASRTVRCAATLPRHKWKFCDRTDLTLEHRQHRAAS